MSHTLVLGLGNILLADEGVGVRVVERLDARFDFPEGVRVLDGGTLGLDLLPYVEAASHLLVVDAVRANKPPGSLIRVTGEDIPIFLDVAKVSAHQEGLQDLLAVSALAGCFPDDVVFWGVQIEPPGVGLALSPAVASQVDKLVDRVIEELGQWGICPQ